MVLTTDSAINQQIAIKTIKKFGFSVTAVWNGREALDYLLEEPSSTHSKPDIILMDVQMPILDGYRATHLIRHHNPYASIADIRNLPIVAMTASAIQGDREKCRQAGMDDYLAKPVKGKTLENMLLKWAVEGRRKERLNETMLHHNDHDSNCTDPDSISNGNKPIINATPASTPSSENAPSARIIATTAALPGTESEGDRGMQRVEAEEKATALRDDKLLAASEANPYQRHITPPIDGPIKGPGPSSAKLTEENITRLDRAHEGDLPAHSAFSLPAALPNEDSTGTGDSLAMNSRASSPAPGSTVGSLHSPGKLAAKQRTEMGMTGLRRGHLARKESDRSQETVRQGDVWSRDLNGESM